MQIVTKDQPFVMRDFRQGRMTPASLSDFLVPQNSVQNCINVNFDTIVGSAVVRPGTTFIGSTIASNKAPIGLTTYVLGGGSTNTLLVVFNGASTATLYYLAGSSWNASNLTTLTNNTYVRFAELGGQMFLANGVVMKSTATTNGATWGTTNCITTDSVLPSLLYRYTARLLASGDMTTGAGHSRSRVYFSSIVDPSTSPGTITWNTDPSTGDWIDINPDDGGYITGFSETSTFLLVFKNNAMYRLDTVNKSADPNNIFNIGAVSQEGIIACQGIVYFYTGIDIRQTDGGFPQQISRAGVQDIIDAIPQQNRSQVAAGTDGLNIYFSLGNVTLHSGEDNQVVISNCVLKFSPRDQAWSVHSYYDRYRFYTLWTDSTNGTLMRGAETGGDVQTINLGTDDFGIPINFQMETQDLEFGNRGHLKSIGDKMTVFTQNGGKSSLLMTVDGQEQYIDITLQDSVNYSKPTTMQGHFFTVKWFGTSVGTAPVFEGFQFENVTDSGSTNK